MTWSSNGINFRACLDAEGTFQCSVVLKATVNATFQIHSVYLINSFFSVDFHSSCQIIPDPSERVVRICVTYYVAAAKVEERTFARQLNAVCRGENSSMMRRAAATDRETRRFSPSGFDVYLSSSVQAQVSKSEHRRAMRFSRKCPSKCQQLLCALSQWWREFLWGDNIH